jgi:hypothetical protein
MSNWIHTAEVVELLEEPKSQSGKSPQQFLDEHGRWQHLVGLPQTFGPHAHPQSWQQTHGHEHGWTLNGHSRPQGLEDVSSQ